MRVYTVWGRPGPGGRRPLGNRAIRLFAYMALRSMDGDAEPWCGVGHKELATLALGLDIDPADKKADDTLRKVRRVIQQLSDAGAITMTRRATYGFRGEVPAKYRLHLDGPASPQKLITARSARPADELGAAAANHPAARLLLLSNPSTGNGAARRDAATGHFLTGSAVTS